MNLNAKAKLIVGTALLTAASAAMAEDLVCFYEDSNYQGNKFCQGESSADRMPMGWNDRISSVKVDGSSSVTLYENDFSSGRSVVLTASEPHLVDRGFNDMTSSFKISRHGGGAAWVAPNPTPPSVTAAEGLVCFYEHANYQGGKFCQGESSAAGMPMGWNDRMSSVKVNGSALVTLYEHVFGFGRSILLTASEPNLVARGFNDMTSSFTVIRSAGSSWVPPNVTVSYAAPSDANTQGAQLFKRLMPAPVDRIKQLALKVAQTLYRNPNDSSRATKMTFVLKSGDFVANATGIMGQRTVTLSTTFLEDFYRQHGNNDRALLTEIEGVLVHELTHLYQLEPIGAGSYDHKSEFWAFIEGEADAVRTTLGYTKDRNPQDTVNSPLKWLGGYNTTGFFLDYIARTYDKDFLYKFNDTARTVYPWTFEKAMQATVGKSVSTLWDQYVRSLP